MGHRHGDRRSRSPLLWVAFLAVVAAGAVAVAVLTGGLQLGKLAESEPSAEQAAQQRCESEVMERLMSPDKASISDIRTESSPLDPEGRDFSALTASEPLRDIGTSRITVLNVSGVANAESEVGTTIEDHFDCRAYFVDGELIRTLVVFDHGH